MWNTNPLSPPHPTQTVSHNLKGHSPLFVVLPYMYQTYQQFFTDTPLPHTITRDFGLFIFIKFQSNPFIYRSCKKSIRGFSRFHRIQVFRPKHHLIPYILLYQYQHTTTMRTSILMDFRGFIRFLMFSVKTYYLYKELDNPKVYKYRVWGEWGE